MSGQEWIIEAYGCDPAALSNLDKLRALFAQLVAEHGLHTVGEPVWHQFPTTGGITGLCLLAESHLACHTFPEYGSLCLNLFCCRPRTFQDPTFYLQREFGATVVRIREIERQYQVQAEGREKELLAADERR